MRIRVGNDIHITWILEQYGEPVILSEMEDIELFSNHKGILTAIPDDMYEILHPNTLRIEIRTEEYQSLGSYNFEFKAMTTDLSMSDDDRKRHIDKDFFRIVSKTAEADDIYEIIRTSDIGIGFLGKPFTYDMFTPSQLALLKGKAFTFADFTPEQLLQLKGERFKFSDFTVEQLALLKGQPFIYSDFTPEQLTLLKGSPFKYSDFTPEQLALLKGNPFTFSDFTPEQLLQIKGEKGSFSHLQATLTASNWVDNKQSISVTGVTPTNFIIFSPRENIVESEEYTDCGVFAISQSANTMNFVCSTKPTIDITLNIEIK